MGLVFFFPPALFWFCVDGVWGRALSCCCFFIVVFGGFGEAFLVGFSAGFLLVGYILFGFVQVFLLKHSHTENTTCQQKQTTEQFQDVGEVGSLLSQ